MSNGVRMTQPLVLNLPYPPSMNQYWRNVRGRTLISQKGRAFKIDVQGAVVTQHPGLRPIAGPVSVILDVTPPDRRRRDIDNLIKPTLDALTSAGVWSDDSQVIRLEIAWTGRIKKPGHAICMVRQLNG